MLLAAAVVVLAAFAGEEGAAAAPAKPALIHQEGPMEKVLADARLKGRPVMIDFFTEWCGWCKVMDKQVFADEKVAGYCNDNYLVFKVDAEKGEGVDLAAKYGVHGYPTFVFVDATGDELDRQVGYSPKEKFLPLLKEVRAGDHAKGLKALVEKNPGDAVARAKLGIKLFGSGDVEGARGHLEKAVELDPKDANPTTIEARYRLSLLKANEEQSPDPIAGFAKAYPDSPAAVEAHRILLRIAGRNGNEEEQAEHLEFLLKKAPDAQLRNEMAWLLATGGKDLDRALSLVTEALKEEPKNSAYLDTKAECLSRLGRHDEAVEAQKQAVAGLDEATPAEQRAEYQRRLEEFTKKRDEAKAPKAPEAPPAGGGDK